MDGREALITILPFTIYYLPFLPNLFQQRIDALSFFFDRVADEVKRGSMPQIEREAKLPPHVRRRVTQRAQSQLVFPLVSLDGDVDAGITQIVCDSHLSHGDHRQLRVL